MFTDELLGKLRAFAEAHPEVLAAAEAEAAQAAQVAAPREFDVFEVIRELARRTGLIGGPDAAMGEKAEAAITAYAQAHPAPATGDGQPAMPAKEEG